MNKRNLIACVLSLSLVIGGFFGVKYHSFASKLSAEEYSYSIRTFASNKSCAGKCLITNEYNGGYYYVTSTGGHATSASSSFSDVNPENQWNIAYANDTEFVIYTDNYSYLSCNGTSIVLSDFPYYWHTQEYEDFSHNKHTGFLNEDNKFLFFNSGAIGVSNSAGNYSGIRLFTDAAVDNVTLFCSQNYCQPNKEFMVCVGTRLLYSVGNTWEVDPAVAEVVDSGAYWAKVVAKPQGTSLDSITINFTDSSSRKASIVIDAYPETDNLNRTTIDYFQLAVELATRNYHKLKTPYRLTTYGEITSVANGLSTITYDGYSVSYPDTTKAVGTHVLVTGYGYKSNEDYLVQSTGMIVNDCVTITYELNGGKINDNSADIVDEYYPKGHKLTKPADPVKADTDFVGWYNGQNPWDFDTVANRNITLKALYHFEAVQDDLDIYDVQCQLGYSYDFLRGEHTDTIDVPFTGLTPSTLGTNVSWQNGMYQGWCYVYGNEENNSITFQKETAGAVWSRESQGLVKSITVSFKFSKKTIRIFGSNTPYEPNASNFIDTGSFGTLLRTLSSTSNNQEVTYDFTNDYEYFLITAGQSQQGQLNWIKVTWDGDNYNNVDFRIKMGVDSYFIDSFGTIYNEDAKCTEYGICVSTSTKTKYYDAKTYEYFREDGDIDYITISLGNPFMYKERFTEQFTFKAYAIYGGYYHYSTTQRTCSIADLVDTYYSMGGETANKVKGLYDLLVGWGYITL